MVNWKVTFSDGSEKIFTGYWSKVLREIANYCSENNLVTVRMHDRTHNVEYGIIPQD